MEPKSPLHRLLYLARDWRSRAVFGAIRAHCRGEVLDVGGWDFYATAVTRGAKFERWTTLEVDESRLLDTDDPRVTVVHGDGCAMTFQDASFDTVLNLTAACASTHWRHALAKPCCRLAIRTACAWGWL